MNFSSINLQQQLLETAAGQSVYDALVQANVNPQTVSLELVKQMLVAEYAYRRTMGAQPSSGAGQFGCALAVC
ncbi:MAG: hypothetical protein RIK87_15620 [Fuerstiella sp.]